MNRGRAQEGEFPISIPQTPDEYLDILRFRWYWIVIGLFLGAIGSQVAVRTVPKLYVSRTVVLVEGEKIPDRFIPRITTDQASDRLRTIHEEILARPTIERILDDLNPYPELQDAPRAQVVDMIRSRAGIGLRGNEAFVVEYQDTDPERAQLMASRLASLFIERTSGDRAAQALDANQFIEAQLEETKRDLETVEGKLGEVKRRNMGMLPRQLGANLATLERLELQRQSMENQIRGAIDRRTLIERQLALQTQMSEPEAQLLPTFPTGGTTSTEPSSLSQLRQYLAQLRTRYTDEHPEVQATMARIARLEKEAPTEEPPAIPTNPEVPESGDAPVTATSGDESTLPEEAETAALLDPQPSLTADVMVSDLRAQLAVANRELGRMQNQYVELQNQIALYQSRVERIPEVEQELQALERDYAMISSYYSELMSRKLEAETAGAVEKKWQEQFSIVDPAQVPRSPSSPNTRLFLLAGIGIGLGAGFCVAFLLEVLDPSVKSIRALEAMMPYPVLLTLPQVKVAQRREVVNREPTPPTPRSGRRSEENELSAAS